MCGPNAIARIDPIEGRPEIQTGSVGGQLLTCCQKAKRFGVAEGAFHESSRRVFAPILDPSPTPGEGKKATRLRFPPRSVGEGAGGLAEHELN